jgi:aspartate racemase
MALELSGEPLALPGLHVCDIVATEAAERGYSTIGVLGTRYTMDGSLYPDALGRRELAYVLPEADDRELINAVIFDELLNGELRLESRSAYVRIIADLADRGCDAVALVCTEIPLLVTPEVSPLPTLDSTRLLARAAFEVATHERPFPTWRGGPPSSSA